MQVDRLHSEKGCLQKEKAELQRTVTELGSSIDKMHRDKIALESQMEMEEEGIVNRLNRCVYPNGNAIAFCLQNVHAGTAR